MKKDKLNDRKAHTWILGIGGSEVDDVVTELLRGTLKQALKYMLKAVKNDRGNDPDKWENGAETLDDIHETRKGHYCASGNYYDYHIDYSITLADKATDLSPAHKRRKDT